MATFVTRPFLPPLEEVVPLLEQIWESGQLSNNGPLHQQLEAQLATFLGVRHVSLFCNATIALIAAQQALGVSGEVVTTPYSFVATVHAQKWAGNTPVFADIDPESLTLDPEKIEAAITTSTSAIMPLHCYGNTCDVEAIASLAKKYDLRVIYDACHSFGVEDEGGSVLRHGDVAVCSFHATKVFNTFEGGLVVSRDAQVKEKIDHLKNFGFVNETTVVETGINGKMSELNAAVGLVQLKYVDHVIAARANSDSLYRKLLEPVEGITFLKPIRQRKSNFSYFPIFLDDHFPLSRDDLVERLRQEGVYARRYFYPLISEFPMYRAEPSASASNLRNAMNASRQVICLPLYAGLERAVIERIADVIGNV